MKSRRFNQTGRDVSEIGLGCWQLGADWGDVSDSDAMAILHKAAENGITFYDTADVYGLGRSESLIGRFLKDGARPEAYVATKLGRYPDPGWPSNFTFEAMRKHTEASLRRLGVDVLDLTQLHCVPTEELRRGDVFDHLRKLKEQGKIKGFGASVESIEEADLCLAQEGLASLQIIFNIFRQRPIYAIFNRAKALGVAIIVRLPLASGLLAGKMTKQTQFAADDHRSYNREGQKFNVGETFAGLPFDVGIDLVAELRRYVPRRMTMPAFALRWILDHDAVSTVIAGASRPDQVAENVVASQLDPLPVDLHEDLRRFYRDFVHRHIRGPY